MATVGRVKPINQYYASNISAINASNDAADEIIAQPDRHVLSQSELFAAQGGWNTVAFALAATAAGTFAVLAGSPRTAAHLRSGSMTFLEWACLGTSGAFWYGSSSWAGSVAFGDSQKVRNHWMAYTFIKSQNRFEGRRILTKAPTY